MNPRESPSAFVFSHATAEHGTFDLRRLQLPDDLAIVHDWVSRDYAHYWGLRGQSLAQVDKAYREIVKGADVFLGFQRGQPVFLVELYAPSAHRVGEHYPVQAGDRGMHVLVAPAAKPSSGFTWSVFRVVMAFLFDDPRTERVVVEPDIRNAKIHALNRRAGFRYERVIELPAKRAHLAFCTRAQFHAALRAGEAEAASASHCDHVQPQIWSAVNRRLVTKSISELAHERVLEPVLDAPPGPGTTWGTYVLVSDNGDTHYRFRARVLQLNHWDIEPSSIAKTVSGEPAALDAMELVLELKQQLGLADETLPVYLEEITSTLYALAYKHARQKLSAADLVHAEFQEIEAAMSDGHPCFIANSGRVGFDANDYLAYAPETGADVQLVWVAAHRMHTEVSCAADLDYERLMAEELGSETLAQFRATLRAQRLDPEAYLLLPVHPWQWFNKLAGAFAPDIATRELVCLGYGPDRYRAQQSIRTFFNTSHPHKRYVKTALSVLNMGFMRGLSADYMRATPAINDYLDTLIRGDAYFARHGFAILREVAGIGYRNPRFEAAVDKHSPYRKMLAALWRESPVPQLARGQRLMTMAALLHRDRAGAALLPQLIAASGLSIDAWLDAYLDKYLAPLLHCLQRYELAFMPHGENVILLLDGNVPARVFLKDIAEEAALMDSARVLPEAVSRLSVQVPDELKSLSIFTDVFDDFLRFVAQILMEQADYPAQRFWQRVAACMQCYQREQPEYAARLDLFAPQFRHSCLNRLQLRNNRQMVDLANPAGNLQFAGWLENPVGL